MQSIQQVCIYGMGGVGGYFGGQMALAQEQGKTPGTQISFIARGQHLTAIKNQGLEIIMAPDQKILARPNYAEASLNEVPKPDVLFLCVKSYHLPEAMAQIKPFIDRDTLIVPLLNGFDIYYRVKNQLNEQVVLPSCCYIVAKIEQPGVIWQNGGFTQVISGRDNIRQEYDGQNLTRYMEQVGINFSWHDDSWPSVWEKYLFIAGLNLVNTRYKILQDSIMPEAELMQLYCEVIGEMVNIAKAMGSELNPEWIESISRKCMKYPPNQTTSFQRDLMEAGKSTESEIFGQALVEKGRELNVPTPAIGDIVREIAEKFPN